MQIDGHGPDDPYTALLLQKSERMRDIAKARVTGDEPKSMERFILRNPDLMQTIPLDGGVATRYVVLANGNRTGIERFDFQLSIAPLSG